MIPTSLRTYFSVWSCVKFTIIILNSICNKDYRWYTRPTVLFLPISIDTMGGTIT